MSTTARAVVVAGQTERSNRQRRSVAEKRRIVEETFAAGASVAGVARTHGVNANQVFNWRRLYQRGLLGGTPPAALVSVKVAEAPAPSATPESAAAPSAPSGSIQLRLPKGQLHVEGAVDPACLRVVLDCLLG